MFANLHWGQMVQHQQDVRDWQSTQFWPMRTIIKKISIKVVARLTTARHAGSAAKKLSRLKNVQKVTTLPMTVHSSSQHSGLTSTDFLILLHD